MSKGLIRNVVTLGGWTLLSRGAGFARDVMMANYLGAGPMSDAFFVAQSLPNMFRRFFAEGAFNMAFVPMFSKRVEAGEDPRRFAQDAFYFHPKRRRGPVPITSKDPSRLLVPAASPLPGGTK